MLSNLDLHSKNSEFRTFRTYFLKAQQQQRNSRLDRMVSTQTPVFMQEICNVLQVDPCDPFETPFRTIMGECNNLG